MTCRLRPSSSQRPSPLLPRSLPFPTPVVPLAPSHISGGRLASVPLFNWYLCNVGRPWVPPFPSESWVLSAVLSYSKGIEFKWILGLQLYNAECNAKWRLILWIGMTTKHCKTLWCYFQTCSKLSAITLCNESVSTTSRENSNKQLFHWSLFRRPTSYDFQSGSGKV